MAQPHEPDIIALLRLCDVQGIPLRTNIATAEILVKSPGSRRFCMERTRT